MLIRQHRGDLQAARVGFRVSVVVGVAERLEDVRLFAAEVVVHRDAVGEGERLGVVAVQHVHEQQI